MNINFRRLLVGILLVITMVLAGVAIYIGYRLSTDDLSPDDSEAAVFLSCQDIDRANELVQVTTVPGNGGGDQDRCFILDFTPNTGLYYVSESDLATVASFDGNDLRAANHWVCENGVPDEFRTSGCQGLDYGEDPTRGRPYKTALSPTKENHINPEDQVKEENDNDRYRFCFEFTDSACSEQIDIEIYENDTGSFSSCFISYVNDEQCDDTTPTSTPTPTVGNSPTPTVGCPDTQPGFVVIDDDGNERRVSSGTYNIENNRSFDYNVVINSDVNQIFQGTVELFEGESLINGSPHDNGENRTYDSVQADTVYTLEASVGDESCASAEVIFVDEPEDTPTPSPTPSPSPTTTNQPSATPSPTPSPSPSPTITATIDPSSSPTPTPTITPTITPSPTLNPSITVTPTSLQCGDDCEESSNGDTICGEGLVCDEQSNRCILQTCADNPDGCTDDLCNVLIPDTSITDNSHLNKITIGAVMTLIGILIMSTALYYNRDPILLLLVRLFPRLKKINVDGKKETLESNLNDTDL